MVQKAQEENENNSNGFFKKSLICGKWTILGAKKTRGHNSGLVLRISFYFYMMREIKSHMKVMSMIFSKELCGGKNGEELL